MTTATTSCNETSAADNRRLILVCYVIPSCLIVFPILGLMVWMGPVNDDPSFLVRVSDAHGLDPRSSPVLRPEFNLTVRVDNNQDLTTCRDQVTVTVFYGGKVVVGWAEMPDFCVDKQSSMELNVPLSHADVVLNNGQRQRMAVELRSGELELGVEMRMVFPKGRFVDWDSIESHASRSRQLFQVCSVKPEQGYAPCDRILLT
ncbi:unnamed protein product [Urochloa decumbens]|uniref:Uncharacterized protein n=1 Tax=Urochloa decumbens TaxID=240449 RepID=A0ABC8ZP84_9POAL